MLKDSFPADVVNCIIACLKVKQQECYVRASEVEVNTEGHFLPESRKNATALYFDENLEQGMEYDDISSTFHYGIKSYLDTDVDLRKKVPELDYSFREESGTENMSDSSSPGATNYQVEPSKSNISELDHQPDQFKMITPGNLHGRDSINGRWTSPAHEVHLQNFASFRNIDNKRPVARAEGGGESCHRHDKKHNVVTFHNPGRVSWVSRHVEPDDGDTSFQTESEEEGTQDGPIGSFDDPRDAGAIVRQKRFRQPPQRYIDESSRFHSKKTRARKASSVSTKKGKLLGVSSRNKQRKKGSKMPLLVSYEASPGRSARPVPFLEHQDFSARYLPRKDYSMNRTTNKAASLTFTPITGLDSDSEEDEYYPSASTSVKRTLKKASNRKKGHRPWSVSEVEKLVDGISRFGVGKWTAIKRTFFSTSHRTCLDIRDKWRNLLRASSSKCKGKTKDTSQQQTEDGSQPLMNSLLESVSELASRHPFPRKGPKFPRTTKHDLCLPWPE